MAQEAEPKAFIGREDISLDDAATERAVTGLVASIRNCGGEVGWHLKRRLGNLG